MNLKNLFQTVLVCLLPCVLLGNHSNSFPIVDCDSPTNFALNKSATQSSTSNGGVASRAVDGNTNGDFWQAPGSVSQTNWSTDGWWQVDLGDVYQINDIEVWNQTSGNTLEQYYVFVSEKPFDSYDLQTTLSDPSVFVYHYKSSDFLTLNTVAVKANGRYVRVQRNGQGFVTLAELKVNGCGDKIDVPCVPFTEEATIISETVDTTYRIDLVNVNDTSLRTIELEVKPDDMALNKYGRFLVRDNYGNILLDEVQNRITVLTLGSTHSYQLVDDEGYLDSVRVMDTDNNIFYIPLSPQNADLDGVEGPVNPDDLIFDASNSNKMAVALNKVTINFLSKKGYVLDENFKTSIRISNNGDVYFFFYPKHEPTGLWLGINTDNPSLHYKKDLKTPLVATNKGASGGGGPFSKDYDLGSCGVLRFRTNAILPGDIDGDASNFFKIVKKTGVITYRINSSYSILSQTCSSSVLKATHSNCEGELTFLWDNKATTPTIADDGLSHTAQVTCECEMQPCITPYFRAFSKCKEGDDENFYFDVVVTEGNNVPYIITNDINSSTVTAQLNEPVEIGPFPNESSIIIRVINSMDSDCSAGIADLSGDCSPCAEEGGDSDKDGICDNQDCAPADFNLPAPVGSQCDDGDTGTDNDVILEDGCTCRGTKVVCVPPVFRVGNKCEIGDTENFYLDVTIDSGNDDIFFITNNADSSVVRAAMNKPTEIGPFPNNWNVTVKVRNANNGECFSLKDKNTWFCTPCYLYGGDSDGDGICDDNDCNIWNTTIPAPVGSACDDGNPNTENDQIVGDMCTCEGTLITGVTDVIPTCGENGGSISFDESLVFDGCSSEVSFAWSDGGEEFNRENLEPGDYTISITDRNGCVEELTYNIPDISNCNFAAERIEIPNNGSGSPCFAYTLIATTGGQEIPSEFLQISWTVTGGAIIPYYSSESTVEINTQAEDVNLSVDLVLPGGGEPCCTFDFSESFTDAGYCIYINDESPFLVGAEGSTDNLSTAESSNNNLSGEEEINGVENNDIGVDKLGEVFSSLEVYPNPFREDLNVDFQSSVEGDGKLYVFNSLGKLVYSSDVLCTQSMQQHQIDFGSGNTSGMYLIQVHYPDGQVKTAKAVYINYK